MPQRFFIENPKAFIDGSARVLDLSMNGAKLAEELLPIRNIGGAVESCLWAGRSAGVHSATHFEIPFKCIAVE